MLNRLRGSVSLTNTDSFSDRVSTPEMKQDQCDRSPRQSNSAICLSVSRSVDRKSSSGRSESSESDDYLPNRLLASNQDASMCSSNGEQRRRSWRSAMMEAKNRCWNVLKSSATFHGSTALSINSASSDRSGAHSTSFNTGPNNTVSEADEEYSPGAISISNTKPTITISIVDEKKKRKNISRDPRAISMPSGLCEQHSWSRESSSEALSLFNFSARQRQSLRCTWYRIRGNGGLRFAERIFQNLFESAPYVKDIFYKAAFLSAFENSRRGNIGQGQSSENRLSPCRQSASITTCRDHAWIVLRLLDSLILDWEDDDNGETRSNEPMTAQLQRFGAQHAFLAKSAGMRADLWEMFGEVAVDIVRRYDCIRSNTDASRAWRILFASITDEVREGYERELRKRCCSAPATPAVVDKCILLGHRSQDDF